MASEKKALEGIALLSMYGDEDDEMKNSMGVAACVVRPPSASHPIDLHRHAQPPAAQSIYTATLSHPPTFAPSTANCCITDTTSARAVFLCLLLQESAFYSFCRGFEKKLLFDVECTTSKAISTPPPTDERVLCLHRPPPCCSKRNIYLHYTPSLLIRRILCIPQL